MCPYYSMWYEVLRRSLSNRYKRENPSYEGVSVCSEWLHLSGFKNWVLSELKGQPLYDRDGCRLEVDKDLSYTGEGSKIYSPETCILLPRTVNRFLIQAKYNDSLPVGISITSRGKRLNIPAYVCRIRNPLTGKERSTSFSSEEEAKDYWVKEKIKICKDLCDYYHLPDEVYRMMMSKVLR